jgi:hypothetical protein
VRDELASGILVEHWRIPEVTKRFYAIFLKRRFPNTLVAALLNAAHRSQQAHRTSTERRALMGQTQVASVEISKSAAAPA